jgi:hypothetical protein
MHFFYVAASWFTVTRYKTNLKYILQRRLATDGGSVESVTLDEGTLDLASTMFLLNFSHLGVRQLRLGPTYSLTSGNCASQFCGGESGEEMMMNTDDPHFGQLSRLTLSPLVGVFGRWPKPTLHALFVSTEHDSLVERLVCIHRLTLNKVMIVANSARISDGLIAALNQLPVECHLHVVSVVKHHSGRGPWCEGETKRIQLRLACFRGPLLVRCGECDLDEVLHECT